MPARSAVASSSGRSTSTPGRRSSKAGASKKTTSQTTPVAGISKSRKSKAAAGSNNARCATLDAWVVRDSPTATPKAPETGGERTSLRCIFTPDGKRARHLDVSEAEKVFGLREVFFEYLPSFACHHTDCKFSGKRSSPFWFETVYYCTVCIAKYPRLPPPLMIVALEGPLLGRRTVAAVVGW